MTYSQGGPGGYPPPQQPAQPPTSYGAPGQSYSQPSPSPSQQPQPPAPAPTPSEPGESKLPQILTIAVAVLGLLAYVSSFASEYAGSVAIVFALLGGLLAGVGVLPKQTSRIALAAVLAVTGALVAIVELVSGDSDLGSILILAFTIIQAIVAVVVLLFEAGVITPPVPQPKYDQQQYGYGAPGGPGGYYGQGPGQHQQRPGGYPPPQQGYGGYQQGPSTGGFPSQPPAQHSSGQHSQHDGPPTPPTGFPQFGQPPAAAPTQTISSSSANSAPTTQVPTTQAPNSQAPTTTAQQPPAQPPQQSGPAPS